MKHSAFLKVLAITLFFQLFLVVCTFSQDITVYGRVRDIFNRTMMGASVKLMGTTTEVFTDSMGDYQITVPLKGKLVFSKKGFLTQKMAIKGKSIIDVSLNLDLNKEPETANKSSVDKKMLEQNKEADIAQLLTTVPGVKVVHDGGEIKLLIRGMRSVYGNNYALIVLNGSPFYGSLNDLNRNDIESIEVLKDAASMTGWGSRGANGIVLISTKVRK